MGRKFPNKMTWDVGQVGVYQPPEEIVSQRPDSDPLDIWSCLRLRGLGGRLGRYEGGLAAVNDDRITRDTKSETTVGTWICHKDSRLGDIRLGPRLVASSLIVLVFRAEDRHVRDFASRLKDFFNRRHSELLFDALKTQPLFIYVALYECFNSFTTFFYQYQEIYMKVVSDHEKRRSSVFSRSFRLNQSLMHMSYCQEDILVHRTTLANIQKLNGDPRNLSCESLQSETCFALADCLLAKSH
ncbi:hypothetical protein N8I77_009495 [Diaporthe amygdali]|uniref:Uncharacterized protein n=1 Tax=Phomopsis amygdali TaxID=1214568 RepID=A0AAD9W102_PHOAM|nr:hypothetical protein N8I77_009495 [Diaporthe amygdali]